MVWEVIAAHAGTDGKPYVVLVNLSDPPGGKPYPWLSWKAAANIFGCLASDGAMVQPQVNDPGACGADALSIG